MTTRCLMGVAVEKLLETAAAEACAASGTINDVPNKIDVIIIKVKTTFANAFLNRCTYIVTYLCFHEYTYCHPHPPTRKTSRQRCQGIHSGILIFTILYSICYAYYSLFLFNSRIEYALLLLWIP